MTVPKLAYSAKEAGEALGVSQWTVFRLVERGYLAKLPHMGKRVVIARVELERFACGGQRVESEAS